VAAGNREAMMSLKHSKALSFLAGQVGSAAAEMANEVLDDIGRENLTGREETITPQIAREHTAHLFKAVQSRLNNKQVYGVSFKVHCFKHSEEKHIGADIAGIMTIRNGPRSLSKLYLAQAKVASYARRQGPRSAVIHAGDRNLLRQCEDMLDRSSASYVFVYSKLGVHVVPAGAVKLKGEGFVDTSADYYRSLKVFYTEFFKCFLGDTRSGDKFTAASKTDEVFRELRASNGLAITAELDE
jgi:hypothetical protein